MLLPERQGVEPARGLWTNLGRLPLRVFSIGKYAFQKKCRSGTDGCGTSASSGLARLIPWLSKRTSSVAPLKMDRFGELLTRYRVASCSLPGSGQVPVWV